MTGGEITHFVALEEDITERKEQEERFRALLEAAPDAMVIVNQDGTIFWSTPRRNACSVTNARNFWGNPLKCWCRKKGGGTPCLRNGYLAHAQMRTIGEVLELTAQSQERSPDSRWTSA